jgi:hypothetical protein
VNIDMLKLDRGPLRQVILRDHLVPLLEVVDGGLHIDCIPGDDGIDDEVEAVGLVEVVIGIFPADAAPVGDLGGSQKQRWLRHACCVLDMLLFQVIRQGHTRIMGEKHIALFSRMSVYSVARAAFPNFRGCASTSVNVITELTASMSRASTLSMITSIFAT